MTFFKSFQTKLALGSAALLTAMSAQVSANSATIDVGDDGQTPATLYTATVNADNYINVDSADTLIKTGTGILAIENSQGAVDGSTSAIMGLVHLQEGSISVSHPDALGNGQYWDGSALAPAADNKLKMDAGTSLVFGAALNDGGSPAAQQALSVPLALNNTAADDAFTIDLAANDNAIKTISALDTANSYNLVLNFISSAAAEMKLDGAYTQGDSADKMVVGENVTLSVADAGYLAPNVDLQDGSVFKATADINLPKISVVAVPS